MDRRRLGKFDVLCRLSTGGMSEIYLAQQGGVGGFNKLVVLKTILPDISGEEDFVRMFLDEARTTASFNHPNIAQVYELDTADGVLFMAMEFVQGCTLVEMARACRQVKEAIPIGLTLAAVRDTALALHYAHTYVDPRGRRQIVIHRDVAEKNIMVTYEGVTKLLDFGIAKALGRSAHTSVGMVKGTSGYMSPEQIRGEPLDPRSDIFSLGVVLHECLTGLRLFHGKNAEEGMKAALQGEVAPPSKWNPQVSPEIDGLVMKALQKDRDARFSTALEFARAIDKVAAGLIWHPEQSGELVLRHFADRRAETRRMLDAAFGSDMTGEIRVQSLIAKMKASEPKKATPPTPEPVHTPAAPVVPVLSATQPGVVPHQPAALIHDPATSPARPKMLRPPTATPPQPAPPQARSVNLTPQNDFDDDSDAKTIPAAALPEEIRELRKRIAEEANAKRDAISPGVTTQPEGVRPVVVPPPVARASAPNAKALVPAGRTTTGETQSITHQWDDEDDEPMTTVGDTVDFQQGSITSTIAPLRQSGKVARPSGPTPRPMKRRTIFIVAVATATLIGVLAVLVLFDLIPGLQH